MYTIPQSLVPQICVEIVDKKNRKREGDTAQKVIDQKRFADSRSSFYCRHSSVKLGHGAHRGQKFLSKEGALTR